MTARRMTSGERLKERKGLCITRGYETLRPGSSRFTLTMPSQQLHERERSMQQRGMDRLCETPS